MSVKKKNAIWIFGDQHPMYALSCNGDPNITTPNLDRLADGGVNCTQAVGGFPLCCPFRGSLLTSQYPHKCVPGHEYRMPPEMKTVAHAFKEHGYDTAYYGKWHVDGHHERDLRGAFHIVPKERRGGFDTWVGYENNNSQWDCWVHGHRSDGTDVEHQRLPGYETDCLTDLFLDYLDEAGATARNGDKPFFAALSVQPPHNPYLAPEDDMAHHNPQDVVLRPNVPDLPHIAPAARKEVAGMAAMVENLDYNVGRIMHKLFELGIDKDTHILFFSDHGDMHGSQGQFKKTCPWEESIRVPFIIGGLEPTYGGKNAMLDYPVNHVDIAPTTLGLCGIVKPDWMAGTDYSSCRLHGPVAEGLPDSAYLQSVVPTMHGDSTDRPWRGIVTTDGWKYVCLEHQPWLLFNLNSDPYEQVNLAHNSRFHGDRQRLQARLKKWIEETGDEFALPEE